MGWLPWILSWTTPWIPINRLAKQVLLIILIENPIEFQVAYLAHSVKQFNID